MPRRPAAAALALLAASALAGCGKVPAAPTPSPASRLSPDQRAVCQQVLAVNGVRSAAFERRWQEVLAAVAKGDEAASASAGEIATQELYEWARELEQIRPQATDAQLKQGLGTAVGELKRLASVDDETPAAEMLGKVGAAEAAVTRPCQ